MLVGQIYVEFGSVAEVAVVFILTLNTVLDLL